MSVLYFQSNKSRSLLKWVTPICSISLLFCTNCVSFGQYKSLQASLEEEKKRNAELKQALMQKNHKMDNTLAQRDALHTSNQLNEKQLLRYKKIIEDLKNSLVASHFKLRSSGGRLVLVLPADILFTSGSDIISKNGIGTVEKITHILIENPNCKYQIEGHTDDVPIHTPEFPSNWELAAMRALNVLHAMVAEGMPPERISSASFADTRPIRPNDDSGRAYNRRIEIALIPDLSGLALEEQAK